MPELSLDLRRRGAQGHWPEVLAVALGACVCLVSSLLQRWRYRRAPPGSMGLPFIGETLQFILGPKAFVEARAARYGPIFKTSILFSPVVHLSGEHAKLFLKTNVIGWPAFWSDLLGQTSIAAINGPRHKFQRSVCVAAFTDEALEGYLPEVQRLTEKHLALWAAKGEAGPFEPQLDIKAYAFDVAEQVLFRYVSSEVQASLLQDFSDLIQAFESILPFDLPFLSFGKGMRARRKLLRVYQGLIDDKRRALERGEEPKDMLALIMAEGSRGEPMSNEELLDFCILVQFAGHDTTKATMQTLLYYLDKDPEARADLASEVAAVWDGRSQLTMKQVQACMGGVCGRLLDEALRTCPPIQHLFRVLPEDVEVGGYHIPRGWKISMNFQEMHGTDDSMPLDLSIDHKELRGMKNVPFGLGARMCLGYRFAKLELIVWLMCLVSSYQHEVLDSTLVHFPMHFRSVTMRFWRK